MASGVRERFEPLRHFVSDSDFRKGLRSSSEFIDFRILRSPGEVFDGLLNSLEFNGVLRASAVFPSGLRVSPVLRASSESVVGLERFVWFFKVIRTSLTLSGLPWGSAECSMIIRFVFHRSARNWWPISLSTKRTKLLCPH